MGFSIHYRSTQRVDPAKAQAVERAATELCRGRSWLKCEPVYLMPDEDGHLRGSSKPNFLPHPDDAAAAAGSGLPDGTTRDMLEILCRLSREYGIDWEIGHDQSDGPIGYVRGGVSDEVVEAQVEAFADLVNILEDELDKFEEEDRR
jgi:hypothetical protein